MFSIAMVESGWSKVGERRRKQARPRKRRVEMDTKCSHDDASRVPCWAMTNAARWQAQARCLSSALTRNPRYLYILPDDEKWITHSSIHVIQQKSTKPCAVVDGAAAAVTSTLIGPSCGATPSDVGSESWPEAANTRQQLTRSRALASST
jgi:hypothetical protein